jgi:AraC-like DNA-binding protein
VARQLDYSSGAAFRRALRRYVGLTPTEVVERGGISVMLSRFLDRCGFGDRREDRSVA